MLGSCHAASSSDELGNIRRAAAGGGQQVEEDFSKCRGYTLDGCEIDEGSVLAKFDGVSVENCQWLCNMTYVENCKFFLHEQESDTCQLISKSLQHYIDSCKVIGGPPTPPINTCWSSDPCKDYLPTMCDFSGNVLLTLPHVTDVERCQESCRDLSCRYFIFQKPHHTCTLYQSIKNTCGKISIPPSPEVAKCLSPSPTTTTTSTMPTSTTITTTTPTPATTTTSTSTNTETTTTPSEMSLKLLVIGGYEDLRYSTNVEKINPLTSDSSCSSVPDYPYGPSIARPSTAQNIGNQFIVTCGDGNGCYSYDEHSHAKFWLEYEGNTGISIYESVLIGDDEMWVLGSDKKTKIISTKTKGAIRGGPDLPLSADCVAKINATHVFIRDHNAKAYIVNVSEEPFEFTRLPDMKKRRVGPGCGFIMMKNKIESGISSDGEPAVIVAGGWDYSHGSTMMSSEIFLIEKNQWVEGPTLPREFQYGGSVNPNDRTFILAGGEDSNGKSYSDIFQLDVETMQFVTLPGKLKKPRYNFAMTWMMDDEQC